MRAFNTPEGVVLGLSLPGWRPENTEISSFSACGSTEKHLAASKCFSSTLKLHQGFHMALVLPGCLFRYLEICRVV